MGGSRTAGPAEVVAREAGGPVVRPARAHHHYRIADRSPSIAREINSRPRNNGS